MEKKMFQNAAGEQVMYLQWTVFAPRAAVVISHGMVEHPARYDDLASFLNSHGISVYGIYHIGHGEDAKVLNHMGKGGFDRCVANLNYLVKLARAESRAPVVLLGHSMGSFMAQHYITRYHNLDGLILSGSTTASPLVKVGAILAKVMCLFSIDKTKPSPFLNTMAFGSYNKAFPDAKTDFDWLSRDEEQVQKYIDDPLCGGICSVSFYQNLTAGMASMGKPSLLAKISKDLPIYIQGGSKDPVSEMGQGLYSLKQQYDALEIRRVKLDVYPEARHEIFNELNREEVYRNTLSFILSVAKN